MGPTCKAMILCQEIDKGPPESLLNLLYGAKLPELPYEILFRLYIVLTGGKGLENFSHRVLYPDGSLGDPQDFQIDFTEPSQEYVALQKVGFVVRAFGVYYVQLWYGDDVIFQRTLRCSFLPETGSRPGPQPGQPIIQSP